jgi:hypothetical protein
MRERRKNKKNERFWLWKNKRYGIWSK